MNLILSIYNSYVLFVYIVNKKITGPVLRCFFTPFFLKVFFVIFKKYFLKILNFIYSFSAKILEINAIVTGRIVFASKRVALSWARQSYEKILEHLVIFLENFSHFYPQRFLKMRFSLRIGSII